MLAMGCCFALLLLACCNACHKWQSQCLVQLLQSLPGRGVSRLTSQQVMNIIPTGTQCNAAANYCDSPQLWLGVGVFAQWCIAHILMQSLIRSLIQNLVNFALAAPSKCSMHCVVGWESQPTTHNSVCWWQNRMYDDINPCSSQMAITYWCWKGRDAKIQHVMSETFNCAVRALCQMPCGCQDRNDKKSQLRVQGICWIPHSPCIRNAKLTLPASPASANW